MPRSNLLRNVWLFFAGSAWVFLLLSLASFHPTDWPSHQVYPWPQIQNLCGAAGAFVAYHLFLAIGQGVFPVLFFTGVCLVLLTFQSRIGGFLNRLISRIGWLDLFINTLFQCR